MDKIELRQLIAKADIISFDIYDTLIRRKVGAAADIFDIVERQIQMKRGVQKGVPQGVLSSGFRKNRIEAEKMCRRQMCRKNTVEIGKEDGAANGKYLRSEVTIDQIYEKLIPIYGKDMAMALKETEVSLEKKLSYVDEEVRAIFHYAVGAKKQVLLITDMYLPESTIKEILQEHGIKEYDGLFVSSQSGYQKSTGALYAYIRKKRNIKRMDLWIHFGDHLKSDYYQAKRHHILAYLVGRKNVYKDRLRLQWDGADIYARFGYNVLGPWMLGYILWLGRQFELFNIKQAFFLSREGYFIMKCFIRYYGCSRIKTNYLYVSRKSLLMPVLDNADIFCQLLDFRPVGVKNAYEYLLSLGFGKESAKRYLRQNQIHAWADGHDVFRNTKTLLKALEREQKGNKSYLPEYLFQEKVGGTFAVVDVGWTGTMQVALEKNLASHAVPHEIYGFFMGQRPEMKAFTSFGIRNRGWLCSYDGPKYVQQLLLSGTCLFEMLMMPPQGTTVGYRREDNGTIAPVLEPCEYGGHYKKISVMQKYALKFIDDYKTVYGNRAANSKEDFMERFSSFLRNPDAILANAFGDIVFSDSGMHKIAPKVQRKTIKKLIQGYVQSYWKVGYLKRNIKIPLPYFTAYCITRKIGKWIKG